MCCLCKKLKRWLHSFWGSARPDWGRGSRDQRRSIKLLLLGTGAVGKSTFIRNLQASYGRWDNNYRRGECAFDEESRLSYKQVVHSNIFKIAENLIHHVREQNLSYGNPECYEAADAVLKWLPNEEYFINEDLILTSEMAGYLETLWADPAIQTVFNCRHNYLAPFMIEDSAPYFMQQLSIIAQPNYIPTIDDVLHCRKPTTGFRDYNLRIDAIPFTIRDIGGDASERVRAAESIIEFLQANRATTDIVATVFMASLSDYNQRHPEHPDSTLLDESVCLFQLLVRCPDFQNISFIVFLNKQDVFREKLARNKDYHLLNENWPQGSGVTQQRLFDWAETQVIQRFHTVFSASRNMDTMFIRPTCATDPHVMPVIFTAARNEMLTRIMFDRFFK